MIAEFPRGRLFESARESTRHDAVDSLTLRNENGAV